MSLSKVQLFIDLHDEPNEATVMRSVGESLRSHVDVKVGQEPLGAQLSAKVRSKRDGNLHAGG
jgi:hypothetical protein